MESWREELYKNYLSHAGIKGMKWHGGKKYNYGQHTRNDDGKRIRANLENVKNNGRGIEDQYIRVNNTDGSANILGNHVQGHVDKNGSTYLSSTRDKPGSNNEARRYRDVDMSKYPNSKTKENFDEPELTEFRYDSPKDQVSLATAEKTRNSMRIDSEKELREKTKWEDDRLLNAQKEKERLEDRAATKAKNDLTEKERLEDREASRLKNERLDREHDEDREASRLKNERLERERLEDREAKQKQDALREKERLEDREAKQKQDALRERERLEDRAYARAQDDYDQSMKILRDKLDVSQKNTGIINNMNSSLKQVIEGFDGQKLAKAKDVDLSMYSNDQLEAMIKRQSLETAYRNATRVTETKGAKAAKAGADMITGVIGTAMAGLTVYNVFKKLAGKG